MSEQEDVIIAYNTQQSFRPIRTFHTQHLGRAQDNIGHLKEMRLYQ